MDHELVRARRYIQEKIFQFLTQRQPQSNDISQRRIIDLVKRLEEGLFRTATSQEDYMNLDTLESRLHVFIKRPQFSSNNPQRSHMTSAPLSSNNTLMNMESANNGSGFPNNDSSFAPQRLPQKQSIGNQNSSVLQSLGNQFENQFVNMEVQSQFMESSMAGTTSLSTPETDVNSLMQQVADDYGLEVSVGLPQAAGHAIATPSAGEKVEEDDLLPGGSPISRCEVEEEEESLNKVKC